MKDNQMKQADDEFYKLRGTANFIKAQVEVSQYFDQFKKYEGTVALDAFAEMIWKAKLTNSQVSEPAKLSVDDTRRIFREWEHAGETPYGLYARFVREEAAKACFPTTPPQEAISPAIAEYIKALEDVFLYWKKECTGHEPSLSVFYRKLDQAFGMKPTGLE